MRRFWGHLYVWVLLGIFVGGGIGYFSPSLGESLKPIGDAFIALIKMLIAPIIFCTVVAGLASVGDMRKVGRIAGKALIYFEIVSTFALAIGLVVANWLKPGHGFHAERVAGAASPIAASPTERPAALIDFVSHIIPKTFLDAFTSSGDLLQVLLLAILFGWAMNRVGPKSLPVLKFIEGVLAIFFSMIGTVMKLAPIGAGAAMAYTIGRFGVQALLPLGALMFSFYLTCGLFIVFVLAPIAARAGFNIFKFIWFIRQELLLVLGTSSSESALVPLIEKLERLGCSRAVVGIVIPAGYSFNLDGTNIYLTLSALFIAQAYGVELTPGQQLSMLLVAVLTSKGASGVTGAGFVTLAATLAVVPQVPVAGLALILGVDRFMSEARALTNIIGNGVATIVVARWERELDPVALRPVAFP